MAEERLRLERGKTSFDRLGLFEMIAEIGKHGQVRNRFKSDDVFEVEFISDSGYKIIESIPAKEAMDAIVPDFPLKSRLIKIYEQILLRAESHPPNAESHESSTQEDGQAE